jgi:hypothetical protein
MGAEFDGKKNVVVGRGAGIGRPAAFDVIDRGGTGGRGCSSATYASS